MPLDNLTFQFLTNVYLHELDVFVKHTLYIKYSLRYVDDFVLLEQNKKNLWLVKELITRFLQNKLVLTLHSQKSRIIDLEEGVIFLGLKHFYYHKLLKESNLGKIKRRIQEQRMRYKKTIL